MQAGVGLLVLDVMPIYMIIPRYSHNNAQFYQLLDSNLFTHRNTYAILREATTETYGPRVYLPSYYFPINLLFLPLFILQSLFSNLYNKNTKNIYLIISIRSHPRKWSWSDWQPLIALVASSYRFVQVRRTCAWPPTGLIPWLSKLREILMLLYCIILSSSGKTNAVLKR